MKQISAAAGRRLSQQALRVLEGNSLGDRTKPSPHLYPHQWLWDSCFIAIGLRHHDIGKAQTEITSLLRGQWSNGMLPHIIFSEGAAAYHAGPKKWRTELIQHAPKHVRTTGITQPPMLAEAVVRIGELLSTSDKIAFYHQVYPGLRDYHAWLYRERDPQRSGLVTLIHPWESGLDNTPYWMYLTHTAAPLGVKLLRGVNQADKLDLLRKDTKHVPARERLSPADLFTLYHILRRLKQNQFDLQKLNKTTIPLVQDVVFNAVLVRANQHLVNIATTISQPIPNRLQAAINKAPAAFATLHEDGHYWSRNARTHQLLQVETIGSFLALYAGTIPQSHADSLAASLQQTTFWPKYGLASTPTNSAYFKPRCYWQGPVWININWLIADGLERYGHQALANKLRSQSLAMIAAADELHEYYSPLDGKGAGATNFSWTAALALDMLKHRSDDIQS